MPLSAGTRLRAYEIVAAIGAGGMGEVYRAKDTRLHRDVAIKILPVQSVSDKSARRRFRKEALALARLNHPNIATVYEFDSDNGVDFLAMELIGGPTLEQAIGGRSMPEKEIARLAREIAAGLQAAHEQGVVHRDLKPSNIQITSDGRVKILDFGVAQLLPVAAATAATESVLDTQTMGGTLPYMAPEQLRGEAPDPRTDIYAAGVVLYEMATGHRPFTDTGAMLIDSILHREASLPASVQGRLSPALQLVVLKALDKDPARRYQSAREFGIDLERLASPVSSSAVARPVSRLKRIWPWATLALLIAGILAGSWYARKASAAEVNSVAVLPFANSNAEYEYRSEGLTEAVTNQLSTLPRLRVMARSTVLRYKGQADPRAAGRDMKVDAVLTGQMLSSGSEVQVSAELVDVTTGAQLWSGHYARPAAGLASIEQDVAREVTHKLRPGLDRMPARKGDPEAYDLYLKGRYFHQKLTTKDARKANNYYQQAINRDSQFALPYAWQPVLYETFGTDLGGSLGEVLIRTRQLAQKSIQLDESLAEGHAALASVFFGDDWDATAAEREYRRALELNPNSALARHEYSHLLMARGRMEEAFEQSRKFRELDPLSPWPDHHLGENYFYARQYDRAIEQFQKALEMDPKFSAAHYSLGWALLLSGRSEPAGAELLASWRLQGVSEEASGATKALERGGVNGLLRFLTDRRETQSRHDQPFDAIGCSWFAATIGRNDTAFKCLDRAYRDRQTSLMYLKVDPRWDPLRADLRFAQLALRIDTQQ